MGQVKAKAIHQSIGPPGHVVEDRIKTVNHYPVEKGKDAGHQGLNLQRQVAVKPPPKSQEEAKGQYLSEHHWAHPQEKSRGKHGDRHHQTGKLPVFK